MAGEEGTSKPDGYKTFMFAVVFPGQGSQKPGACQELYLQFLEAKAVFTEVSDATGIDMKHVCFELSPEELKETQNAQLALFTTGVAAYRAFLAECEMEPAALAGHSVGEYAAIVAAGAISLEDGAKLVQRRGQIMAAAGSVRPGAMAAVLGMDLEPLSIVCNEVANVGVCVVANDNCAGQLVISGDARAVEAASVLATEMGARRVLPLPVSGAFHSPLMEDSAAKMGEALHSVSWQNEQRIPVFCNVHASSVKIAGDWPVLLKEQLKSPVRWRESVIAMIGSGIRSYVECGSGEVLTGLLKRIDPEATGNSVNDRASLEKTKEMLKGVLL